MESFRSKKLPQSARYLHNQLFIFVIFIQIALFSCITPPQPIYFYVLKDNNNCNNVKKCCWLYQRHSSLANALPAIKHTAKQKQLSEKSKRNRGVKCNSAPQIMYVQSNGNVDSYPQRKKYIFLSKQLPAIQANRFLHISCVL